VRRLQVGKLPTVYGLSVRIGQMVSRTPSPKLKTKILHEDSPPDANVLVDPATSDHSEDSSGVNLLKSFGLRNDFLLD